MADEGRVLDDLDEMDIAILRMLGENGRLSNAHLARSLGVSEPTIRKRIDRLVDDEIIKVVAVLNPRMTGYTTDVLIGISVQPGEWLRVGNALAESDNCVYLGYTTGRYDLLVEMLFRDDQAFFRFLDEELPTLGQIARSETLHVLRAGKINYDWKLPAEFGGTRFSGVSPDEGGAGSAALADNAETKPARRRANSRRPAQRDELPLPRLSGGVRTPSEGVVDP
jgi:Lrp/AsnC family transcriptional regulator for asnA, asnC and gidA